MSTPYLNGFSNVLGTVSVAEGRAHSQFNSLGVVQSVLLGRSGCCSSRKPGWLHFIDQWNTDFKSQTGKKTGLVSTVPLCKFSLLPLWSGKAKKWPHNCGASMIKNLKTQGGHLIWFFFLFEVKTLLPFLLLNLSFQQSQKKLLSFGVSCPLVLIF